MRHTSVTTNRSALRPCTIAMCRSTALRSASHSAAKAASSTRSMSAIAACLDGSLIHTLKQRVETEIRGALTKLRPEEAAVLALLQERLKREEAKRGSA